MRPLALGTLLLIFTAAACDDTSDGRTLTIMTGTMCGWCGGSDSLALNGLKAVYEFEGVCNNPDKSITETIQTEAWRDLVASLNWKDFKNVNVSTCAICSDGCDTWIRILNGTESHYIRFTDNSPEIGPITSFVNNLKMLHNEFRQK
jgi:hypothetical protein